MHSVPPEDLHGSVAQACGFGDARQLMHKYCRAVVDDGPSGSLEQVFPNTEPAGEKTPGQRVISASAIDGSRT